MFWQQATIRQTEHLKHMFVLLIQESEHLADNVDAYLREVVHEPRILLTWKDVVWIKLHT